MNSKRDKNKNNDKHIKERILFKKKNAKRPNINNKYIGSTLYTNTHNDDFDSVKNPIIFICHKNNKSTFHKIALKRSHYISIDCLFSLHFIYKQL